MTLQIRFQVKKEVEKEKNSAPSFAEQRGIFLFQSMLYFITYRLSNAFLEL